VSTGLVEVHLLARRFHARLIFFTRPSAADGKLNDTHLPSLSTITGIGASVRYRRGAPTAPDCRLTSFKSCCQKRLTARWRLVKVPSTVIRQLQSAPRGVGNPGAENVGS